LTNRLRELRAKGQKRAANALLAMQLSAGLLVCFGLIMGLRVMILPFAAGSGSAEPEELVTGLIVAAVLGVPALLYAILVFTTAGKLYPYYYRLAWQQFIHANESVLLVDEERLRLIQQALPGRFWGAAAAPKPFENLLDRLEFGAFHLPSLRSLADTRQTPSRGSLLKIERARRNANYYDQAWMLIAGCVVGALIGWVGLGLMITSLVYGALTIQAYARLAAFIDLTLDEPQIDVRQLPAAPYIQGWWAQTTAPWRSELAASQLR
jgi:hypothetical protein